MSKTYAPWRGLVVAGALLLSLMGSSAWGGTVSGCTADTCTWEISVDGGFVMGGSYTADADGNISFGGTGTISGDGYTVESR